MAADAQLAAAPERAPEASIDMNPAAAEAGPADASSLEPNVAGSNAVARHGGEGDPAIELNAEQADMRQPISSSRSGDTPSTEARTAPSSGGSSAPSGGTAPAHRSHESFVTAIVERLTEQMQQGVAPWMQAQVPGRRFLPYNAVTGRPWRGANAIILMAAQQQYGDLRWVTEDQARTLGAEPLNGESTTLYWWRTHKRCEVERDGTADRRVDQEALVERVRLGKPEMHLFGVRNAEQFLGFPRGEDEQERSETERHALAEAVLARSGAPILRLTAAHDIGLEARYDAKRRQILIPPQDRFGSLDELYSSAMHALARWAAHRSPPFEDGYATPTEDSWTREEAAPPFNSLEWAQQELRVSIAAMKIGDRLRIGYAPSKAARMGAFIQVLQNNPHAVLQAAADAERITNLLTRPVQDMEMEVGARKSEWENAAKPAARAAKKPAARAAMKPAARTVKKPAAAVWPR